MCASSYKLEVKNIKLLSPNLKTSVLASENLTSADETILFGTSNTCVWHVKQYCLKSETILFRGINVHLYPSYGMFMQPGVNEYS